MVEDFALLQKGIPAEEQHGSDTWEMSLRDAWTKFVAVGNSLSGIYLPIALKTDDDMSNFVKVRRPSGARMRTNELTQKLMAGKKHGTISTKTWKEGMGGELFRKRMKKYNKQLKKLWPHEPEFEELEVYGYRPGTSIVGSGAFGIGSTGNSVEDAAPATAELAPAAALAEQVMVGPALDVASERVLLRSDCGEHASTAVKVRNSGSTALYYTWTKVVKPNVLGKKLDGVKRLWFAGKPGVVLPGHDIELAFSFKSDTPGQWSESWELTTQPTLPGNTSVVMTVKGVAIKRVENTYQRNQLEQKLADSLKMSTVSMLLGDMAGTLGFDGMRTPSVIQKVTDPEGAAVAAEADAAAKRAAADALPTDVTEELFNAQNRRLNLFFSSDLFPSFEALAQQVFDMVDFPAADRVWDLSVESVYKLILAVKDEMAKQRCLDTLAALVKIAATPPTENSLQYAIAHTLLADMVNNQEATTGRKKSEMQELGQYPPDPPDPPAPEEGEEPTPPPELTQVQQAQVDAFKEEMGAQVKTMLGDAVNAFERLSEAGEAESRHMALAHFGLIPGPDKVEEEEEDDDEDKPKVPPLGTKEELEQYSMSALNMSANVTGSQMYSSLVDGGGHTPQGAESKA